MPVYDYKCSKCDITRTITLSIKEDAFVMKCECGERMNKVFGINAVQFKGGGFYSTDKKNG